MSVELGALAHFELGMHAVNINFYGLSLNLRKKRKYCLELLDISCDYTAYVGILPYIF